MDLLPDSSIIDVWIGHFIYQTAHEVYVFSPSAAPVYTATSSDSTSLSFVSFC